MTALCNFINYGNSMILITCCMLLPASCYPKLSYLESINLPNNKWELSWYNPSMFDLYVSNNRYIII